MWLDNEYARAIITWYEIRVREYEKMRTMAPRARPTAY